jgi:hypothetical protein
MAHGVPTRSKGVKMTVDPLDVPFDFVERPDPIPATLRPAWRIASLLLCLVQCRGARANRKQLHVLNWAARNTEARRIFLKILEGSVSPDEAIVRFDPVLDRAVQFSIGEKLVSQSGELLEITPKGEAFVKAIMQDRDCMVDEKLFLERIGRKLSQTQVEVLI